MAKSLSRFTLLAYAGPAVPLAALGFPFYIFLPPFYAEDLGLGFALVGQILLLARCFDLTTDIFGGWLVDRSPKSLPRRKFWTLLATPFLLAGLWFLFVPQPGAGGLYLLLWSMVAYLGWTLLVLPFQSWGAELDPSYEGRAIITAWREGATIIGMILVLLIPTLLGIAENRGQTLKVLFGCLAVLLPITLLFLIWQVPEPKVLSQQALTLDWRAIWRNKLFLRLLTAFFFNGLANALPATLFLSFVEHRLQAPSFSGPLLLAYFVVGLLSVPFWMKMAVRIGKHRAWTYALFGNVFFFVPALFLGAGDQYLFLIVCIGTGFCFGADLALPASIQADVLDYDRLISRQERAGLFFGFWGFTTKLALALGVGVSYPILASAGFDPANQTPDETALITLSLLYCFVSLPLKLIAAVLMFRFPLDQHMHARLQRLLKRRAGL